MSSKHLVKLTRLMAESGVKTLVLNPGPTLAYLTGLHFHISERPTVFIYSPPADPVIVLAELEAGRLEFAPFKILPFAYSDNPATWGEQFKNAVRLLKVDPAGVALEPVHLRYLELQYLQQAIPDVQWRPADDILSMLRMVKDEEEVQAMRTAVKIAEQALTATLPSIRPGVTEREVAAELTMQLLRAGSDSELPFAPIVSGGPNGANPHASPTDRKLQNGDLLVIDWGAAHAGYYSDLTRTFGIGKIAPELEKIHLLVQHANQAGRAAGAPGVKAGKVDQAARAVIEQAGYGVYFTHRVGHGLGMEGHEPPYMFGENQLILQTGMTYTVEPGIYLPGQGGVRIEDDVVVTATGAETLSHMVRELVTLG